MSFRSAGRVLALVVTVVAALPFGAAAAPPGSPWGRDYFPDAELQTHDGRTVKFYSDMIENRLVVVSFIYTRCTKVCGFMTANMARLQRELGDRVGKDIFFVSVSLDPEHDTPEILAKYAEAYKVGPGWTFLTGKKENVEAVRAKLGEVAPKEQHAPRVNIGNDRTGQWWRTGILEEPKYLAKVIGGWMDPGYDGRADVAANSYAEVPRVLKESKGRKTFRQKCSTCHTDDDDSYGPDLRGILKRRPEAWVRRWIKEPDTMIREKDPTALEILEKYRGIPMPNVGITDAEVAELIAYFRILDGLEAAAPEPPAARPASAQR